MEIALSNLSSVFVAFFQKIITDSSAPLAKRKKCPFFIGADVQFSLARYTPTDIMLWKSHFDVRRPESVLNAHDFYYVEAEFLALGAA
jgi:hypothetical protein